jgi:hypothetical protein
MGIFCFITCLTVGFIEGIQSVCFSLEKSLFSEECLEATLAVITQRNPHTFNDSENYPFQKTQIPNYSLNFPRKDLI